MTYELYMYDSLRRIDLGGMKTTIGGCCGCSREAPGRRCSSRRRAAFTKRFVSDFGRFVLCGHHQDNIVYYYTRVIINTRNYPFARGARV